MQVLTVTIEARAPLLFSDRRPDGQFRPSTPYVPGSALRGALARGFLDAGEKEHEDFRALFLAPEAPLFRNAYPAERLLPATAYSCKAVPGFRPKGHGVYDGLVDRLCCEELGVKLPYLPRCHDASHRSRGRDETDEAGDERVEAFSGFYAGDADRRHTVSLPSRMMTRLAVNRARGVAEERFLYSPLVIDEASPKDGMPTTFYGSAVCQLDDQAEMLKRRLEALTHVGGGAARGFGRVAVTVGQPSKEDLRGRVEQFNRCVAARWELWQRLPRTDNRPVRAPGHGVFFAVLLLSDAVLRRDGWVPGIRLEPEMLGAVGQDVTLVRCYAAADWRGGWNTGWGLPKDTEMVARMGSVYVYHTTSPDWDGLAALEVRGVGERRAEGFGQVRVCDDFHQEIQGVVS